MIKLSIPNREIPMAPCATIIRSFTHSPPLLLGQTFASILGWDKRCLNVPRFNAGVILIMLFTVVVVLLLSLPSLKSQPLHTHPNMNQCRRDCLQHRLQGDLMIYFTSTHAIGSENVCNKRASAKCLIPPWHMRHVSSV